VWSRVIVGVVLCLIGALWFFQGIGVAKGSPMTGHAGYSVLGAVVAVVGVVLILAGLRRRDVSS
jgi:hypothetical protein